MTETGFETTDWRVSDRAQRKCAAKQAVYGVLRPALSARAARHLSPSFRRQIRPDALSYRKRFPEPRRSLLACLDRQCNEDDLIIKANFVRLLKSGGR